MTTAWCSDYDSIQLIYSDYGTLTHNLRRGCLLYRARTRTRTLPRTRALLTLDIRALQSTPPSRAAPHLAFAQITTLNLTAGSGGYAPLPPFLYPALTTPTTKHCYYTNLTCFCWVGMSAAFTGTLNMVKEKKTSTMIAFLPTILYRMVSA